MNTERLDEFDTYVDAEVLPATADLKNIADKHRKHLQKLVYTNLVDRFDSTIDRMILENCRAELLAAEATKGLTRAVTEADLVKLLMEAATLQDALDEKLQASLRNSVLRERHSLKLGKLLKAFSADDLATNAPKVNVNTGAIVGKMTPQSGSVPYSVCGYADWLYSRRNAIVHGAGNSNLLQNDIAQLKKHYKCTPVQTFKIKLTSVSIAAEFYKNVTALLRKSADA